MLRRIVALILKELSALWKDPKTRFVILVPPLVQEIGRYIYRVQISGDWYVNFADASAKITLGDLPPSSRLTCFKCPAAA